MNTHTHTQTYKQTPTQAYTQVDRQTETHTNTHLPTWLNIHQLLSPVPQPQPIPHYSMLEYYSCYKELQINFKCCIKPITCLPGLFQQLSITTPVQPLKSQTHSTKDTSMLRITHAKELKKLIRALPVSTNRKTFICYINSNYG